MKFFTNALAAGSQLLLGYQDKAPSRSLEVGTPIACPIDPPLSCSARNDLTSYDSCCYASPGGQFAQTQFWNSDSRKGRPGYVGPENSWTIHGLWYGPFRLYN
jgi:ribonuclease T2